MRQQKIFFKRDFEDSVHIYEMLNFTQKNILDQHSTRELTHFFSHQRYAEINFSLPEIRQCLTSMVDNHSEVGI